MPEQFDVVHVQSYSAEQAVEVAFALQGVTVPTHEVVPDQEQ